MRRRKKPIKAKANRKKTPTTAAKALRIEAGVCTVKAQENDEKGNPKLREFEMHAYTGAVMKLSGWGPPVIVDLDGVQIPRPARPILLNHNTDKIVGHSTQVVVNPKGIFVKGLISGSGAAAQEVSANATNGFPWQASIGAEALSREFLESGATATVNGVEVTGPLEICRQTLLGEISFVPLGADGATSAVVASKSKGVTMKLALLRAQLKAAMAQLRANKIAAAKYSDEDIDGMDEDEAKAALKDCMKAADDDDDSDDVDADDDADDDDGKKAKKAKKAKAGDDDDSDDGDKKAGKHLDIKARIQADRDALVAESTRVSAIKAMLKKYPNVSLVEVNKQRVELEAHAIAAGLTVDQAELIALRNDRPNGVVAGGLIHSPNSPELTEAVLEAAILQAGGHVADVLDLGTYDKLGSRLSREVKNELSARYTDKVLQSAHSLFKGRIGLQQVLIAGGSWSGQRMPAVIRDDGDIQRVVRAANWNIQADGGSTMSIANVLANVLNKYILAGYTFAEQAWRDICSITPVRDFKPTKKINVFGDFVYKKLNADGQIQNAAMADEAFANQIDTFARKLNIPRQHIISDDMGALTQVPMLHGIGAMDSLNILFWTVWLSGMGNGPDGAAFWATRSVSAGPLGSGALNSNYISGGTSALSSAALQLARQTYMKQIKPNGQPLGVDPAILLAPVELQQTADELLNPKAEGIVYGGASASRQPNINIFRGVYKPVYSRYLSNSNYTGYSTTAWWLLANPGMIPTIDVAFLNGQEMPTVRTLQPNNDTLGIDIQGFWDFGVAPQNTRGGIKSAGA